MTSLDRDEVLLVGTEIKPVAKRRTLKATGIFRDLSEEQIDEVARLGGPLRVSAGSILGRAGELGECLFIVLEGKAQLSSQSSIGEITVRIVGPGESFPLASIVGSGGLITTAKAMTDMEVLAIARSALVDLCYENTEIGTRIYAAVAEVLAGRYGQTLKHLTFNGERVLTHADFWANV